jgi:hypothetical protein
MIRSIWVTCVVFALAAFTASASSTDRWLHVRVIESGEDGEQVSINLPLPLAESLLQSIQCDAIKPGKVQAHLHDSHIDLPALRAALKQAGDGEYITVDGSDEHVRITKEGDWLHVRTEDASEKVDLRLQLSVLDALLSSGTDEVDVRAALHALVEMNQDTELVRVDSKDESVRIWIDHESDQK